MKMITMNAATRSAAQKRIEEEQRKRREALDEATINLRKQEAELENFLELKFQRMLISLNERADALNRDCRQMAAAIARARRWVIWLTVFNTCLSTGVLVVILR